MEKIKEAFIMGLDLNLVSKVNRIGRFFEMRVGNGDFYFLTEPTEN